MLNFRPNRRESRRSEVDGDGGGSPEEGVGQRRGSRRKHAEGTSPEELSRTATSEPGSEVEAAEEPASSGRCFQSSCRNFLHCGELPLLARSKCRNFRSGEKGKSSEEASRTAASEEAKEATRVISTSPAKQRSRTAMEEPEGERERCRANVNKCPPTNVTELPATRPHLGLLSPTSYAHSGFRLRLWRKCAPQAEFTEVYRFEVTFCGCGFQILHTFETPFFGGSGNSLPLLNCTWATSSDSDLFEAVFSSESAIVASGDSPIDSESSSRFTCSICDAISGSVSSSFGKYRSSSELDGNVLSPVPIACLGRSPPEKPLQVLKHLLHFVEYVDEYYQLLHCRLPASKPAYPSTGPFRRRILGCEVQVSRPDVLLAELVVVLLFFQPSLQMITFLWEGSNSLSGQGGGVSSHHRYFSSVNNPLCSKGFRLGQSFEDRNSSLRNVPCSGLRRWQMRTRHSSPCSNCRKINASELDGSSSTTSVDNSICQLDPGSSSQMDGNRGVLLIHSAQMKGFDAIGEHTGDDHDRNIMVPFCGKPPGSEDPGRNRLPTVPFDGKTIGVIRWRCITFQWPVVFTTDSLLLPTDSLFSFTGRYFRAHGGINKELLNYVIIIIFCWLLKQRINHFNLRTSETLSKSKSTVHLFKSSAIVVRMSSLLSKLVQIQVPCTAAQVN
ncbi:hypothetical protein M5K25_008636 [Dendrobium thyrsiflorum]|uniref:Uncharacterized protein n=1 Tax=Dendrobium thyrsiflorum TaxID=117978 RepID=A0ABD0VGD7_DENTH